MNLGGTLDPRCAQARSLKRVRQKLASSPLQPGPWVMLVCPLLAWDESAIKRKGIGEDNPPSAAPKAGGDKQQGSSWIYSPPYPILPACHKYPHRHCGGPDSPLERENYNFIV